MWGFSLTGLKQIKLDSDWSQWGDNPVLTRLTTQSACIMCVCFIYMREFNVIFQRSWKNMCFFLQASSMHVQNANMWFTCSVTTGKPEYPHKIRLVRLVLPSGTFLSSLAALNNPQWNVCKSLLIKRQTLNFFFLGQNSNKCVFISSSELVRNTRTCFTGPSELRGSVYVLKETL